MNNLLPLSVLSEAENIIFREEEINPIRVRSVEYLTKLASGGQIGPKLPKPIFARAPEEAGRRGEYCDPSSTQTTCTWNTNYSTPFTLRLNLQQVCFLRARAVIRCNTDTETDSTNDDCGY